MKSDTIITSANVKTTLSYNSSFFSIELTIENEAGIKESEVNEYRAKSYDLATHAIDEHKAFLKTLGQNKRGNSVEETLKELKQKDDPKEIAKIQNLPEYKPKKTK